MFSISNLLCLRWTQQRNVTITISCFAGQEVSVVLRITDLSRFRGTQQLAITETMTRLAGQQICAGARRRVSTTLRQVPTEFSEFFM